MTAFESFARITLTCHFIQQVTATGLEDEYIYLRNFQLTRNDAAEEYVSRGTFGDYTNMINKIGYNAVVIWRNL